MRMSSPYSSAPPCWLVQGGNGFPRVHHPGGVKCSEDGVEGPGQPKGGPSGADQPRLWRREEGQVPGCKPEEPGVPGHTPPESEARIVTGPCGFGPW